MHHPLPRRVFLMSVAAAGTTHAQGVWRCGADGKQFTDKPCEQGRVLDTLEPRPAQDLAAAQAQARREQALAAQKDDAELAAHFAPLAKALVAKQVSVTGTARQVTVNVYGPDRKKTGETHTQTRIEVASADRTITVR